MVNAVVGTPPAPSNSGGAPPTISGQPTQGQTLTADPGTWSNGPTSYHYQWRDCDSTGNSCTNTGTDSSTYPLGPGDVGHYIDVVVTAQNAGGPSTPANSGLTTVVKAPPAPPSTPAPSAPSNTSPPTISGTALPGDTLTCNPGTWSGNPTSFDYQWNRDTSQLPGANQQGYEVQIADEGHSLGCGVTASNGGGSSAASASAPVIVAVKGTLNCPKPSGQVSGRAVGPLSLGMKQGRARGVLSRFAVTSNHFDDFCLYGGWGIRVGYPTARLLRSVPRGQRSKLAQTIVIALTANPFYALNQVSPGMSLAAVQSRVHLGKRFHIGANDWYVVPGGAANGVLKVRGGVVQEIGLVSRQLTRNRKAQGLLLGSFG